MRERGEATTAAVQTHLPENDEYKQTFAMLFRNPAITAEITAWLATALVLLLLLYLHLLPALLGGLVVFDDLHFPSNRLADGSLCTLFTSPEVPGRADGFIGAVGVSFLTAV